MTELYSRYQRHLSLPAFDKTHQDKLHQAKILCVGLGGLGCPALLYLAGAGIGMIGIMDDDLVDLSNLQRQIIYRENDIGKKKVDVVRKNLASYNSEVNIIPYDEKLNANNALSILREYDIIIDGSDNFATRYILSDATFQLKKPLVCASVFQFSGQCMVFSGQAGPCYRCIFPSMPTGLNCSEAGVLGVVPGLMGVIQANEVIKLITQIGKSLMNQMLVLNALSMEVQKIQLISDPECIMCSKKTSFNQLHKNIENIQCETFIQMKKDDKPFFLLDVRTLEEYADYNIGGLNIPLAELDTRHDEIKTEYDIIVCCAAGGRSLVACELLINSGITNVKNLVGGLNAYREEESNAL